MSMTYTRSIGDDYTEYVDDEYGYHYHAWEVISASESKRHEEIRIGENELVDSLFENLDTLSDLELWALARRRLQEGIRSDYFSAVELIISGNRTHPAISYPEVFADLARRYAEDGDLTRGRELVDSIGLHWPELADALPLLFAQLYLHNGDLEQADKAYREAMASPPDVDLLIEITEDFLSLSAIEKARQWLEIAKKRAVEINDTASLVDIELLQIQLTEAGDNSDPAEEMPDG